jgi:hypothetical protein
MNKLIIYYLLFIWIVLPNIGYPQTNSNDELLQFFFGEWELLNDKKFKVVYTKDKITYIYNGKIEYTNPINFVFSDEAKKFRQKENTYNFTTDKIQNDNFKIIEYDVKENDTLTSYILYIDNQYLEVIARSKDVTFKKIKPKNQIKIIKQNSSM